jgi:anthranilate/para-aminobenzoate synthase component I
VTAPVRLTLSIERLEHHLAQLPGAFRLREEERIFWGACPSQVLHCIDPEKGREEEGGEVRDVPRYVGLLPYEAFRGIERRLRFIQDDPRPEPMVDQPIWQEYPAVIELKDGGLWLHGAETPSGRLLQEAFDSQSSPLQVRPALRWSAPKEEAQLHRDRVREALVRIARGELYQVNLARRFAFEAEGHPLALLASLGPMAEAPYAAALDFGTCKVVSTSPELFLDVEPNGRVRTRPIKGTRPRGRDAAEDLRLAEELDQSEKERAELSMVIDIERNDLGRLAQTGTVRMTEAPHVVTHPTVHHREATVEALLKPGTSREALLSVMMPSGSVTGAPKVAAMDLISELEAERRGLYTGALGSISRTGRLRLSMAIRVLTLKDGVAHYFAGGGIVADSDPAQEVLETDWKAEQLRALVDVSAG